MASTYALPLGGSHVRSPYGSRSHSHSYSLHEEKPAPWAAPLNAAHAKKNSINGSIGHNHSDHRRSRNNEHQAHGDRDARFPSLDSGKAANTMKDYTQETSAFDTFNGQTNGKVYKIPTAMERQRNTEQSFSMRDALNALLIPLPFMLASFAYPFHPANTSETNKSYNSPFDQLKEDVAGSEHGGHSVTAPPNDAFIQACCLASATLLLVGLFGSLSTPAASLDRRKTGLDNTRGKSQGDSFLSLNTLRRVVGRMFCVGLPFYAAMLLGGPRTSLILLTSLVTGLNGVVVPVRAHGFVRAWTKAVAQRKLTCLVLLISVMLDFSGLSSGLNTWTLIKGHSALALSVLLLPPPVPTIGSSFLSSSIASSVSTSAVPSTPISPSSSSNNLILGAVSPLVVTKNDSQLTLVSGLSMTFATIVLAIITSHSPSITPSTIIFSSLSIGSALGLILFSAPYKQHSHQKLSLTISYTVTTLLGYFAYMHSWKEFMMFSALSGLFFTAAAYDTSSSKPQATQHNHKHHHGHDHLHGSHSKVTGFLLKRFTPGSIVHSILIEKDSRRIAYFAVLNLAFMLVQFFYGFVSGSLGLLTDSIHMLFDCAGLAVGLAAAVMSKWPADVKFPYGYGKVDTLSGFANGIFLMLVSVEIIFDAFERLFEGHELQRLNELLVVSILGFLVNMVGLTAFGHAHHGHDHGHSHGHDHGHDHGHGHGHGHSHSHDNENMQGIFLHILADALGSVAVIISTILTKYYGWSGWDPIASCIIAVLIFASAIPLVKSSGLRLLLSLPADVEYGVRNTLQEIHSLRGVVGYSVPRFWLEDAGAAHADAHAHAHEHSHKHDDHCHGGHHSHDHDHGHVHEHSHGDHHASLSHGHNHSHSHSHAHDHHDHQNQFLHPQAHAHSHSHAHEHNHDHDLEHEHKHTGQQRVLGVIHIIAASNADQEDVRQRAVKFLKERNLDVVVHVEREGDRCWCGGGTKMN